MCGTQKFVLITFESRYTPKQSRILDKDYPLQRISTIAKENKLIHFPLNELLEEVGPDVIRFMMLTQKPETPIDVLTIEFAATAPAIPSNIIINPAK